MNVVGGFHPAEPAIDLGIVLAAASAARNVRIPADVAVFGEVGLSGEVRAVGRAETRLAECAKAGFTSVLLPKAHIRGLKAPDSLQVHPVDSVNAALELLI